MKSDISDGYINFLEERVLIKIYIQNFNRKATEFLSKVKNKILILYISYQIDIIINHGYEDRNVICKNNIGEREVELHILITKTDIVGVTFFCSFPSTAHGALTNHACMSFIAISTCNLVA